MEHGTLLILGLLLTVIGIVNIRGNISTIHAYNRRKVREEDLPKYARAMGNGTMVIGLSLALTAALQMAFGCDWVLLIAAALLMVDSGGVTDLIGIAIGAAIIVSQKPWEKCAARKAAKS